MLLSHQQNAGQNHDLKIAKRLFKNVSHFKYMGITITNENVIQGESKRRRNSGNTLQSRTF
jgi:hypothetical protein